MRENEKNLRKELEINKGKIQQKMNLGTASLARAGINYLASGKRY